MDKKKRSGGGAWECSTLLIAVEQLMRIAADANDELKREYTEEKRATMIKAQALVRAQLVTILDAIGMPLDAAALYQVHELINQDDD